MKAREYNIVIEADGRVRVDIAGYKGKSCLGAVKMFEAMVGSLESQRETTEFYEPEEQVRHNLEQRQ